MSRFSNGGESLAGRIRAETRCDVLDGWLDDARLLTDRTDMLAHPAPAETLEVARDAGRAV